MSRASSRGLRKGELVSQWASCVEEWLEKSSQLEDLCISEDGKETCLSPIARTSAHLILSLHEQGQERLVLTLPKTESLFIEIALATTMRLLLDAKLGPEYDTSVLVPNEKLSIGKAVVRLDSIERDSQGVEKIVVWTSDLKYTLPISMAPTFKLAKPDQPLTSDKLFQREKNRLMARGAPAIFDTFSRFAAQPERSVVWVGGVQRLEERLRAMELQGKPLRDILPIGRIERDGTVASLNTRRDGVSAVLIAPELQYALEYLPWAASPPALVIFEATGAELDNHLQEILELGDEGVPLCVIMDSDQALAENSLPEHGFKKWSWDGEYLSDALISHPDQGLGQRLRNASRPRHDYRNLGDGDLGISTRLVFERRIDSETSLSVARIRELLMPFVFDALRRVTPVDEVESANLLRRIDEATVRVGIEARYLSDEELSRFHGALEELRIASQPGFESDKAKALRKLLTWGGPPRITVVIHNRQDRNAILHYWSGHGRQSGFEGELDVVYADELRHRPPLSERMVVVVGWLGVGSMGSVLFSYAAAHCQVLLYDWEAGWKDGALRSWASLKVAPDNASILELIAPGCPAPMASLEAPPVRTQRPSLELEEVERVVQESIFRRDSAHSHQSADSVEAVPVQFVGGEYVFFRPTTTVVRFRDGSTEDDANPQVLCKANEIRVGDLIALRETDQDLIRELADIELRRNGRSEDRDTAGTWHRAVEVGLAQQSERELLKRIVSEGCTRQEGTILNWLRDREMIAPNDADDIGFLLKACGDEDAYERRAEIAAAARRVQSAHKYAGRTMSRLFRERFNCARAEPEIAQMAPTLEAVQLDVPEVGSVTVRRVGFIGDLMWANPGRLNQVLKGEA